ncbi:class E sortase [Marisediminicola senii]|uniref:class E sortase n=1 Tax=Marisediminicola senii TaxID=2711233 RepID=UPI0013EC9113|nr:class E sortase [Marisediminicola senii]
MVGTNKRARQAAPHRRASVISVLGELLITAGVFVFLFLGWQLWLNDLVLGAEQQDEALSLSEQLGAAAETTEPAPEGAEPGEPVITLASAENERFATIFIPRFGADYARTVAEGISPSTVLKDNIGHYPGSQMPGEIGNFAVAGHRTTWGAPFNQIATLELGDKIYVQTADGWYTYVYRSSEYVLPTGTGVIAPVPQAPNVAPTDRIMTMTSCNPMLSDAERIIAYAVFESWQPASAGAPAELAQSGA